MDFIRVAYKENKDGTRSFYPALLAVESQDLVIRGGQFAAIWDDSKGLYNRRLSHVPMIVDREFARMVGEKMRPGDTIKKVREFDNQIFSRLMGLIRNIGDMGPDLDLKIVFANETPTRSDAATFKMPYSLSEADCPAWDELLNTLYEPHERLKIEYAIGSVFTGASLNLQKFYVFFGPPGSGKSTILDIIEKLFAGHTAAFNAAEMGRSDSQFSLEPFKLNPLVAIDQDADLSKIETNVNLNKITAHDKLQINSKGKSLYEIIPRSLIFVGTNMPVKITDKKSGLYRRLVDIQPTGNLIEETKYHQLMAAVEYELGAIAAHCISVFEEHGPTYLSSYRSTDMMYRTNDVFNFVQDNRLLLQHGVTLKQAHKLWLDWCEETETRNVYKRFQFRDQLKDYFEEWHDQIMIDGVRHRSYFHNLKELEHFTWKALVPDGPTSWLEMKDGPSLLDDLLAELPAQPSTGDDAHPLKQAWDSVTTKLADIDTTAEHFVKVPVQHIVIDFDITDESGVKNFEKCVEAASLWPPTYAEPSRSGNGLHLHYEYDGDVERLAGHASPGVEVKTLLGGSSLRRRHSRNNQLPVATISSGLPFKEEKVISATTMANEKSLRRQIAKCLKKEIHPYTKPSMDMLQKVLDDAVKQGMVYDVTDMWDDILEFAMGSSNQRSACIEIAMGLPLKSEEVPEADAPQTVSELPIADFDLEVYPNLLAIGYLVEGSDQVVKMINPTPQQVEELFTRFRLIGYYNRMYDNHILWAASLGWDNQAIFEMSQKIVAENDRRAGFVQAYNLAYGDLYDMLSADGKMSLKAWEIKLGLPHKEMDLPWDEPVPEDRFLDVMDYLENDVRSTRAVRKHREADVRAREILAEISGLAVCNTNRQHTEKLIFGDVRDPSSELKYTELKEMFPGYEFDRFAPGKEKSTYKGEVVGEGGWVYSEPGMYENVAVLDVASMHPTSIIELNLFGKYTENFKRLMDVRLALKHGDLEKADAIFDGRLKPFLGEKKDAKALSNALKTVINSVYGLTAASFDNKFRDPDNVDNIVAKRGALFMVDLKEFVEKAGFKVVHIKTDSIKIPDATPEIIAQVGEFGAKYGYSFEHEATYDRFVLLNDAVFVNRYGWAEDEEKIGKWDATGKQYQHPVVFKTLFSKEEILPKDYVEVKQVAKGHMYLVSPESEVRQFVGKFGAFVPVLNGRELVRIDGEKGGAVTGTKGHLWELAENVDHETVTLDMTYYQALVDDGIANIEKYGSYQEFVRE